MRKTVLALSLLGAIGAAASPAAGGSFQAMSPTEMPADPVELTPEARRAWGVFAELAGTAFMREYIPTDMFGPTGISLSLSTLSWEVPGQIMRSQDYDGEKPYPPGQYRMTDEGSIVHETVDEKGKLFVNRITIEGDHSYTSHAPSSRHTKTLLDDGRILVRWEFLEGGAWVPTGHDYYLIPMTREQYLAEVRNIPNRLMQIQQRRQQLAAEYMAPDPAEQAAIEQEWAEWEANLPWKRNGSTALDGLNEAVRRAEADTRRSQAALDATIANAARSGGQYGDNSRSPSPPSAGSSNSYGSGSATGAAQGDNECARNSRGPNGEQYHACGRPFYWVCEARMQSNRRRYPASGPRVPGYFSRVGAAPYYNGLQDKFDQAWRSLLQQSYGIAPPDYSMGCWYDTESAASAEGKKTAAAPNEYLETVNWAPGQQAGAIPLPNCAQWRGSRIGATQ